MALPPDTLSDVSSGWLKKGQALEAAGQFTAALAAYDQAIASLQGAASSVPFRAPGAEEAAPPDILFRRARGVAWMNRGNALQKLGAEHAHHQRAQEHQDSTRAAVAAYDDAIAELRTLPLGSDPAFRNHLGAAWLNRGHALIGLEELKPAVDSFVVAIELLQTLPLADDPSYRLNLAGAQTNLAHILLQGAGRESPEPIFTAARAAEAARSALAALAGVETAHVLFAEMSLRARRALVVALGEQLVATESRRQSTTALAAEASDVIDDGLTLARDAEKRGAAHLRPLAARLFRMGAQLYGTHQPQFLAEFLLENVDPAQTDAAFAHDSDFRATAEEALSRALEALNRPNLLVAGTRDAERLVATARSLREAQVRLSPLNAQLSTSLA